MPSRPSTASASAASKRDSRSRAPRARARVAPASTKVTGKSATRAQVCEDTQLPKGTAVPFGSWVSSQTWALVALFPVTFVLAGATLALARGARLRESRFDAALALAVLGLLGIYPRGDATHIAFTVALACPLFALAVTDLLGHLGRRGRLAVSALLIGLCLPGVRGALEVVTVASRSRPVPTARGLVVPGRGLSADDFAGDFTAIVAQLDRTPPGDAFFFYPFCPMLPYLTGRRHVAAIDVMTPAYTPVEHFRETCARVVGEAQWVVIEHH